jgi:SAM-dependent methyltransferase
MRRWLAIGLVAAAGWAGAAWAQEEVPFITTPDNITLAMLELAAVTAADQVLDLGSGDGRIVITAAKRFGARGLGVEIVPDLVARAQANARQAGVEQLVQFRVQDLFETDLRGASVITMYLLPEVNLQLRPRLLALAPGTRIVSHDWDLGEWQPERSITLQAPGKTIGLDKRSTLHLWRVPAQVHGLWCAPGGGSLMLVQRFDRFSATLAEPGRSAPVLVFDGRVQGLRLLGSAVGAAELELQGEQLRVLGIAAAGQRWKQALFKRAGGSVC